MCSSIPKFRFLVYNNKKRSKTKQGKAKQGKKKEYYSFNDNKNAYRMGNYLNKCLPLLKLDKILRYVSNLLFLFTKNKIKQRKRERERERERNGSCTNK